MGRSTNTLVDVNNRLATIEDDLGKALEKERHWQQRSRTPLPNPGDRFGLRLNAAGAGSEFAGAVGFSYNVAEDARA